MLLFPEVFQRLENICGILEPSASFVSAARSGVPYAARSKVRSELDTMSTMPDYVMVHELSSAYDPVPRAAYGLCGSRMRHSARAASVARGASARGQSSSRPSPLPTPGLAPRTATARRPARPRTSSNSAPRPDRTHTARARGATRTRRTQRRARNTNSNTGAARPAPARPPAPCSLRTARTCGLPPELLPRRDRWREPTPTAFPLQPCNSAKLCETCETKTETAALVSLR